MVAFFRSPCTICIWDSHTRVKSSYAYGISHTHTGHPVRIWGKMYIWGVTVWISISNARIPGYRKLIPCIFNGNLLGKPPEYHGKHLQIQTKTSLWHTVWGSSWLRKFGANYCKIEEGVSIWNLFGHQFFVQPTTGLRATKQRHPEKAGTILRASNEFHGHRWFCLWAMAILVLISVWNRMTPDPHQIFAFWRTSQAYHFEVNPTKCTKVILKKPVCGRLRISTLIMVKLASLFELVILHLIPLIAMQAITSLVLFFSYLYFPCFN